MGGWERKREEESCRRTQMRDESKGSGHREPTEEIGGG